MNMDDDDDDAGNEYEEPTKSSLVTVDKRSTSDTLLDISAIDEETDVDAVSPLSGTSFFYNSPNAPRTAPLLGTFHAYSHSTPSLSSSSVPSRKRKPSHRRKTSDWFPLHSFMDLRGEREDDARIGANGLGAMGWRSFVEFPGV